MLKSSSFGTFLFEFWEERGEKLMTCHLFLDNFSWNFMTFGLFSKVKSFWNGFLFQENSNISNLISWNIRLFWIFCLSPKTFYLQKIDCVFVLAIRGLLHLTKNFVMWCDFRVLITVTESFWKVSFKKSWCCRKHVFVF